MLPTRQGSFRLFRFAGIDVFLHWSWFLVAVYGIYARQGKYSSFIWNVVEYLALFVIVLMHEFGHALACRQVGGQADQIVLWPLGGVAYVAPPCRPGATLWSIAAGPLVNVMLAPILIAFWFISRSLGWAETLPDVHAFVRTICYINLALLVFNMLPVYPLDGGQILRALLWFPMGRARSLMTATILGFAGVACLIALAVLSRSKWLGILCVFILFNCWRGLQQARALLRVANLPRHEGFACPICKSPPLKGLFWTCSKCGNPFDTFECQAVCPHCATQFGTTSCSDCGSVSPFNTWQIPAPLQPA